MTKSFLASSFFRNLLCESMLFANCTSTANTSENDSRKDTQPLGFLKFRSSADSKHLDIPGLVFFGKIKPFILYANDSVPPQYITNSEQQYVLTLGTKA